MNKFPSIAAILAFWLGTNPLWAQSNDCRDYLSGDGPLQALTHAGDYGSSGPYSVGIILTYGTGNGSTPIEVGDYVVDLLNEEGKRQPTLPSDVDIQAKYFVECLNKDGIGVSFLMGGTSVGPIGIREAITSDVLQKVITKRVSATRLLYNGLPRGN